MSSNFSTTVERKETHRNERVTLWVVIITLIMMIAEITAGLISGSMALLSDGIHMGTHALALFITLAAYIIARRHRHNPRFTFGTGKVGVLGGYTNAILLIVAGLAMVYESVERLLSPVPILFNEALIVAVVGLGVNLLSAVILGKGDGSHHHHDHSHSHAHLDHNLRSAYLHVLTDAMTSVLAISALLMGKLAGWGWADPIVGILGAIVVIKWALGLIRQTGSILLDLGDFSAEISTIKEQLENRETQVDDIHIWHTSENDRSLIICLQTTSNQTPQDYHRLLTETCNFNHTTVEVHHCNQLTR